MASPVGHAVSDKAPTKRTTPGTLPSKQHNGSGACGVLKEIWHTPKTNVSPEVGQLYKYNYPNCTIVPEC